jgi:hypothetical protein
MLVSDEEVERIGRIAEGGQDGVDRDVSKDIVWHDVAGDTVGGMPPRVQRKLLHAVQTSPRLLRAIDAVRIRFWYGGHGCSLG